ncbi:helix-turn-helix transcriptional regulator [Streptomyces iconiensis]|uniref:Helix-turn-helix transcriptional regulator n=1 Tax=Streptomyces iconiensis TaxID=1384038 RepID=A0ABT7A6D1_9ACTN|nr:helix-turn-helix transcriptional regulator [Streptomyces iconiensis]MDJ1136391.1 helix-turn-helix transcriptional regulator [Streptomyces iconiensis]
MANGLRAARAARGMSQERLVRSIEAYARQKRVDIASTGSLRTYVSEWENGKRRINDHYAAILRAILGTTDHELRGQEVAARPSLPAVADGYDELLGRIDSARNVSQSMVQTFMDQTELLRTMDRQMGAASLVDQMTSHLSTLEEALTFAVLPDTRRPVAAALTGAATLAAWQALDGGFVERAWRHYELAKHAAKEADAPMFLVHAMGEQAYVLGEAGRPDDAVALVRHARETGGQRLSPRLQAWLHAAEAELCAKAGMPDDCRRALGNAFECLPAGAHARDDDMPSVFLNHGHLTRWRGNALALLGDDDAVGSLYEALDSVDSSFIRAQAGLRCDLAQAHMVRDEHDQAVEHLREARLLAKRTGSVRHQRRIALLSGSP